MVDALRPRIRADPHIACYFRQNVVLFLLDSILASPATLGRRTGERRDPDSEWVHVDLYKKWLHVARTDPGVKDILSRMPAEIIGSIVRRLKSLGIVRRRYA